MGAQTGFLPAVTGPAQCCGVRSRMCLCLCSSTPALSLLGRVLTVCWRMATPSCRVLGANTPIFLMAHERIVFYADAHEMRGCRVQCCWNMQMMRAGARMVGTKQLAQRVSLPHPQAVVHVPKGSLGLCAAHPTHKCMCDNVPLCRAHKAVLFLLEEFDLFARPLKQTLLYELLDALQTTGVQVRSRCGRFGPSCRHKHKHAICQ